MAERFAVDADVVAATVRDWQQTIGRPSREEVKSAILRMAHETLMELMDTVQQHVRGCECAKRRSAGGTDGPCERCGELIEAWLAAGRAMFLQVLGLVLSKGEERERKGEEGDRQERAERMQRFRQRRRPPRRMPT